MYLLSGSFALRLYLRSGALSRFGPRVSSLRRAKLINAPEGRRGFSEECHFLGPALLLLALTNITSGAVWYRSTLQLVFKSWATFPYNSDVSSISRSLKPEASAVKSVLKADWIAVGQ